MDRSPTLQPGALLSDKLQVVRPLGAGGIGAVYEVKHLFTHHHRALKVLHPEYAKAPEVVERFLREASAAGRIGNPHIVETFDAGRLADGSPYLVMELLQGLSLSDALHRNGRLDPGPAAQLMQQVCTAMHAAHAAGIVHRDLKPDNLFLLEREGRPFLKVLDFGVSKFEEGNASRNGLGVTQDGSTLGTPLYMAPEQMRGAKHVDARADVYSLGVILYECLTATTPFTGNNFAELAAQVLAGNAPLATHWRPELPAPLAQVIAKAIALQPDARFPSAGAFADALAPFMSMPSSAPPYWRRVSAEHDLGQTLPKIGGLATPHPELPTPLQVSDLGQTAPSGPKLAAPPPASDELSDTHTPNPMVPHPRLSPRPPPGPLSSMPGVVAPHALSPQPHAFPPVPGVAAPHGLPLQPHAPPVPLAPAHEVAAPVGLPPPPHPLATQNIPPVQPSALPTSGLAQNGEPLAPRPKSRAGWVGLALLMVLAVAAWARGFLAAGREGNRGADAHPDHLQRDRERQQRDLQREKEHVEREAQRAREREERVAAREKEQQEREAARAKEQQEREAARAARDGKNPVTPKEPGANPPTPPQPPSLTAPHTAETKVPDVPKVPKKLPPAPHPPPKPASDLGRADEL